MAFKLYSDVRETSTTGGTGDQILTGAAFDTSYVRFNDRYSNGDTFFYRMKQPGVGWENGFGTRVASGDKITRTQVYKSSNSNALVNFTNGVTIDIFVTNIAPNDLDANGLQLLRSVLAAASSARTITVLTSGSGTYTTPAGVKSLRIRMIGGGGGGGSSAGSGGGTGGTGGNTTFGPMTANGGTGGVFASPSGGAGGGASLGSGPIGVAFSGASGGGANGYSMADSEGGFGSGSPFVGANQSGARSTGSNSVANTGGGGGGGGGQSGQSYAAAGGGAGGYIDAVITSPSSTYSYAVGAAGTAGSGGTGFSYSGGAGGSGIIIVEEFY